MHGRKQKQREEELKEPEEIRAARRNKLQKLSVLLDSALLCRQVGSRSPETLELCSKLLVVNPSINTLWNIRREAFLEMLGQAEAVDELRAKLVKQELELNTLCLQKGNVKSHEAWSHRMWIVDVLALHGKFADLDSELELCKRLLASDERNFHCYQYRAGVSRLALKTWKDDLSFAQDLIDRNFSNYSAWHLKMNALETMESQGERLTLEQLAEEFDAVNNALYTEPDDQSGWMFHRWLLRRLLPDGDASRLQDKLDVLKEQIKLIEELNEMEEGVSKWPLLALLRMFKVEAALCDALQNGGPIHRPFQQLCETLMQVDENHINYYRYVSQRGLAALVL